MAEDQCKRSGQFVLEIILLLVSVDGQISSPSAPAITMLTLQTTSVLLSWSQSAQDVVDNYTITYRNIEGCTENLSGIRTINGSLKTIHLTDLEESIMYEIIVEASNEVGNSSTSVQTRTLPAGSLAMSSLTYNITSGVVTCVTTGGPAMTVTWSRSGPSYQQNKMVVDTVTATYHNLLSITSSQISDYTGNFTCTVSNSRGKSLETIGPYQFIGLSGTEAKYKTGSSANVTFFSNFTTISIEWWNSSNNDIIVQNQGEQQLILSLNRTSHSIDNTTYIYKLNGILPNGVNVTSTASFQFSIEANSQETGAIVGAVVASVVAVATLTLVAIMIILLHKGNAYVGNNSHQVTLKRS